MAAVTTLDGVKMIALEYPADSDNGKKAKAKEYNFLIYFWHQTVSAHYQVSQQKINDIIHMGKYPHQCISTVASL